MQYFFDEYKLDHKNKILNIKTSYLKVLGLLWHRQTWYLTINPKPWKIIFPNPFGFFLRKLFLYCETIIKLESPYSTYECTSSLFDRSFLKEIQTKESPFRGLCLCSRPRFGEPQFRTESVNDRHSDTLHVNFRDTKTNVHMSFP